MKHKDRVEELMLLLSDNGHSGNAEESRTMAIALTSYITEVERKARKIESVYGYSLKELKQIIDFAKSRNFELQSKEKE